MGDNRAARVLKWPFWKVDDWLAFANWVDLTIKNLKSISDSNSHSFIFFKVLEGRVSYILKHGLLIIFNEFSLWEKDMVLFLSVLVLMAEILIVFVGVPYIRQLVVLCMNLTDLQVCWRLLPKVLS